MNPTREVTAYDNEVIPTAFRTPRPESTNSQRNTKGMIRRFIRLRAPFRIRQDHGSDVYLTSALARNTGISIDTTTNPTKPPMIRIITGSIIPVRVRMWRSVCCSYC